MRHHMSLTQYPCYRGLEEGVSHEDSARRAHNWSFPNHWRGYVRWTKSCTTPCRLSYDGYSIRRARLSKLVCIWYYVRIEEGVVRRWSLDTSGMAKGRPINKFGGSLAALRLTRKFMRAAHFSSIHPTTRPSPALPSRSAWLKMSCRMGSICNSKERCDATPVGQRTIHVWSEKVTANASRVWPRNAIAYSRGQ